MRPSSYGELLRYDRRPDEVRFIFNSVHAIQPILFKCLYCRDLQDATTRHFHSFMKTFVAIMATVAFSGGHVNESAPNPELTGKLFETIGHLLKYVMIVFHVFGEQIADKLRP